jgi:hypothetical protein
MPPSITRHSLTDFVNLKIKSARFFVGDHKCRPSVRVFIRINAHLYMSTYILCDVRKKAYIVQYYYYNVYSPGFAFLLHDPAAFVSNVALPSPDRTRRASFPRTPKAVSCSN